MLEAEIESSRANPWAEPNFLKKAFLEGCKRAGLSGRNMLPPARGKTKPDITQNIFS
jgi:hypothetical protein